MYYNCNVQLVNCIQECYLKISKINDHKNLTLAFKKNLPFAMPNKINQISSNNNNNYLFILFSEHFNNYYNNNENSSIYIINLND